MQSETIMHRINRIIYLLYCISGLEYGTQKMFGLGLGLGLEWDVCVRVEERRVVGEGGSGRGKGRS